VKLVNNYFEAACENVMFGGADPSVPNVTTSDIEVRNNLFEKPFSWMPGSSTWDGHYWSVKNIFELKNAARVLINGNIFQGSWAGGQDGLAIQFTPRNQDGGCPWCTVHDVTFTNNLIRHVGAGISFLGTDNDHPSGNEYNILVENNLLYDVNSGYGDFGSGGSGDCYMVTAQNLDSVTIDHNTCLQNYGIAQTQTYPSQTTNFVFTNNLQANNQYGFSGDNVGSGSAAINSYYPGSTFLRNGVAITMGTDSSPPWAYPGASVLPDMSGADFIFTPNGWSDMQFADMAGDDYHLAAGSPFKNAGTDGKDIGADIDAINAAIAGDGTGTTSGGSGSGGSSSGGSSSGGSSSGGSSSGSGGSGGTAGLISVNASPGLCLNVSGDAPYSQVILWNCGSQENMQFTYDSSTQLVHVTVAGKDQCLNAFGGLSDGALLGVWDCIPGAANEMFTISGSQIQAGGYCIDVTNGAMAVGTAMQVWSCSGGPNQQFTFGGSGSGSGGSGGGGGTSGLISVNASPGLCLNVSGDAPYSQVILWDCGPYSNSQFTYDPSTQLVHVTAGGKDQCLNAFGGLSDGALLGVWDCIPGAANEMFTVSGSQIQAGGYCIDVTNGVMTAGTPMQVWSCSGGPNQQFTWQ
jgi:hypothetical protein